MRLICSHVSTFSFLAAISTFAACASDEVTFPDSGVNADAGVVDAAPKKDATVDAAPEASAPVCVDHCTTNADCMNSCPPSSSGSHCCDQGTGKCYAFTSPSCPADQPPVDDGGVTPPY